MDDQNATVPPIEKPYIYFSHKSALFLDLMFHAFNRQLKMASLCIFNGHLKMTSLCIFSFVLSVLFYWKWFYVLLSVILDKVISFLWYPFVTMIEEWWTCLVSTVEMSKIFFYWPDWWHSFQSQSMQRVKSKGEDRYLVTFLFGW